MVALVSLAIVGTPTTHAATGCAAPRIAFTAYGPAIRVQSNLCQIALSPGANVLRWERAAMTADAAFGGMDFGASQGELSV